MNLFDLVKRKDRCLVVEGGEAEAVQRGRGTAGYLGVRFAEHTHVTVLRADEFTCLSTFPRDLGWYLHAPSGPPEPSLTISISSTDPEISERSILFQRTGSSDANHAFPIVVTWPVWAGLVAGFNVKITNGGCPVELQSSYLFNPRLAVTHLIRGTGVEVGPGANPFVKPSDDIDVLYIEALPVEEWLRNYQKGAQTTMKDHALWDLYVMGDAQQLECCHNESLEFIFCSHVFEHLMNPLGVLENWSRKLKSHGVAILVVPDLRYCFDLRQPPSTVAEWLNEHEERSWSVTNSKYEKWCRYTAPYNTPEDLIRRKYSIHTHYYTPQTFRTLANLAIARGFFSRVFFNTSPNNKDFGVVLWK